MMNEYKNPAITIDGVIFQLVGGRLSVLLVKRPDEPFKGMWALPGGYIAQSETSVQALERVMRNKAGVALGATSYVEQLFTFDTAGQAGGNAISVVYMGLARNMAPDGEHRRFFAVDELPDLAYEHARIVQYARRRLESKSMYTNILFALLSPAFTLSELQAAYEEILGKKLDKRNFRKKISQLGFIGATGEYRKDGAHRPAQLHRFVKDELQELSRSFD